MWLCIQCVSVCVDVWISRAEWLWQLAGANLENHRVGIAFRGTCSAPRQHQISGESRSHTNCIQAFEDYIRIRKLIHTHSIIPLLPSHTPTHTHTRTEREILCVVQTKSHTLAASAQRARSDWRFCIILYHWFSLAANCEFRRKTPDNTPFNLTYILSIEIIRTYKEWWHVVKVAGPMRCILRRILDCGHFHSIQYSMVFFGGPQHSQFQHTLVWPYLKHTSLRDYCLPTKMFETLDKLVLSDRSAVRAQHLAGNTYIRREWELETTGPPTTGCIRAHADQRTGRRICLEWG